ncbi:MULTISPECIES: nucleoside 2-deoxyribosyltransferase [unclassified Streptomyces]|uniref:nucleoside 2-deoxyribosyltransferase n=1 Tax=unclassified Streptomyces TaxID=2593676 RepID=UPI0007C8197D|nr:MULTISPECIES: nucleoside 2-deoxyribosyltransferase [unclassified Streptomyces]MYY05934.1 nucleoside 2-deoxyribosyltransferase [Streptomyces sp. SID4913]
MTDASRRPGRVFLAAPFTQLIDTESRIVEAPARNQLSTLRAAMLERGHSVFLAHEREAWGEELMTPQQCTPLDYREMTETDVVCAYLGTPPSYGVHIELGWASAHRKPVLLVLDDDQDYTPLVWGLSEVTTVRHLMLNGRKLEDVAPEIIEVVESLLAGRGGDPTAEDGR